MAFCSNPILIRNMFALLIDSPIDPILFIPSRFKYDKKQTSSFHQKSPVSLLTNNGRFDVSYCPLSILEHNSCHSLPVKMILIN